MASRLSLDFRFGALGSGSSLLFFGGGCEEEGTPLIRKEKGQVAVSVVATLAVVTLLASGQSAQPSAEAKNTQGQTGLVYSYSAFLKSLRSQWTRIRHREHV